MPHGVLLNLNQSFGDESYVTLSGGLSDALFSQAEIVDFVVWLLFSQQGSNTTWPKHLLCDGFRRNATHAATSAIPGLLSMYPNHHVQALKKSPWPELLMLLGKSGESIMIDLLVDGAMFTPIQAGLDNISRMMYARAALNTRGLVLFGFRHIHVLNRCPLPGMTMLGTVESGIPSKFEDSTRKLLMYVFPRQFGLHNVFSSEVDRRQTTQKFQDYTLREDEIKSLYPQSGRSGTDKPKSLPKRLRGEVVRLIQRLQPTVTFETITDLATPVAHVSAFCQAVLAKLIPDDFWGSGSSRRSNKQLVMTKVHHFVKLRRFESLSLSEVASGLKVTDIGWLAPPGLKSQKTSLTDMNKRLEILNEFLYYVFDSLLIPLLRSNFYVTESSVHRYKLFFFRHDIWRYVAEPAMAELKVTMFEEVKLDHARRILENRKLGFSQVRLLPKQISMRPITNLRRRAAPIGNKKMLGLSINSILGPVYSALKLEKELDPSKLGASMFSVPDVYRRLNAFKNSLGDTPGKLYFVKLDVKAAFDTIPQDAVLKLMQDVTTQDRYKLLKHVEIKAGHVGGVHKPTRRWQAVAICEHDKTPFLDRVESQLAPTKRHTIFIDNVMQRSEDRRKLLSLMTTHIEQNLVKLGKKYYRQKNGIPQGSVLSSTLCNYFYADLELQHLSFLSGQDCMLSRLIDDFLLITTDVRKARRFVKVMHKGFPGYGVSVSPAKTLVNFEMEIDGGSVARLPDGEKFPYCGTLIDCETLAIGKDRGHIKDTVTSNGLTVEFGCQSGHNFMRKTLNAFKIQSHIMFYDTVHNSPRTVYSNLFESFTETATKMLAYAKCLGPNQRPAPRMVIRTISKVIDVAWVLLTSKTRRARFPDYRKAVARKQSAYHDVLEWIAREIRKLQFKKEIRDVGMLQTFEDVAS
ncbi:Telomerase reverse transcriptase like protein [Verticillium longisporum]|nr:Telomerase reverse transcriptase like protein [Verticillium longisporum]